VGVRSSALRVARRFFERRGYVLAEWPGPGVRRDLRGALQAASIDLVLDVGAYDGEYALDLRRLGYEGAIASFEPSPAQLGRLRERSAADPRWTVHDVALSDRTLDTTLHRYADGHFDSLHVGGPLGDRFEQHLRPASDTTVRTRRLDELWSDLVPPGADVLVKTDTQGHDLAVLRGLGDRLPEVALVQCEVAVIPLYEGAAGLTLVLSHLEQAGFGLAATEAVSRGPDHVSAIELDCLFVNLSQPPFDWAR